MKGNVRKTAQVFIQRERIHPHLLLLTVWVPKTILSYSADVPRKDVLVVVVRKGRGLNKFLRGVYDPREDLQMCDWYMGIGCGSRLYSSCDDVSSGRKGWLPQKYSPSLWFACDWDAGVCAIRPLVGPIPGLKGDIDCTPIKG